MELQLAAVEGVLEARGELAALVFWIGLAFADAAVAALTLLKSHEALPSAAAEPTPPPSPHVFQVMKEESPREGAGFISS